MTEASELRWRKTDESDFLAHCPDHPAQFLYYARIYTVRRGFEFSQTNQLIVNLKKSPQAPSNQLYYKQNAIKQFAREVIALLRDQLDPTQSLTLVPIPPSKTRSHPEYDDRVEQVAQTVAQALPNVTNLPLLDLTADMESYHGRSDRRDPDQLYEQLQVQPTLIDRCSGMIALLDDVLTSGAHFTAARRRILEACPAASVIGLFWAKSVSPLDEPEDL